MTSDVDTIARFLDWGALAWIVQGTLLIGIVVVMAFYSWQLMLISVVCYALMLPILAWLQRRQVAAYALRRTRVAQVLGLTGEVVAGAETVRAYGVSDRTADRLDHALGGEYRAAVGTAKYFSILFTIGDLFGTFALIVVTGAVLQWGLGWGLDLGEVVAILLLLNLAQSPIAELSEVLDQTQTRVGGLGQGADPPGSTAHGDRAGQRPGPAGRPGRDRGRRCVVLLPGGPARAEGCVGDHPGRHVGRRGGRDRQRKDHLRPPPGTPSPTPRPARSG